MFGARNPWSVSMSALALNTETTYLREFAKHYLNEVAFDDEGERQMREREIYLVEVHQAMKTGVVISSEKEDAEGAIWIVEGETCDNVELIIMLQVQCDQYSMCIKGVIKRVRI